MTAIQAVQEQAGTDSCDNAQSMSALHSNIQQKQDNSYYYAHKKKHTGEEPAPLPVHVVLHTSKTETLELPTPISHYQYLDDGDFVKVYVPLENVGQLSDDSITCTFEHKSFDLHVKGYQGKHWKLGVKQLHGEIDIAQCQHRKLKDKVIVKMAKVKGKEGKCEDWSALRAIA